MLPMMLFSFLFLILLWRWLGHERADIEARQRQQEADLARLHAILEHVFQEGESDDEA